MSAITIHDPSFYSFLNYDVFFGDHHVQGFGEGTGFEIAPLKQELVTTVQGADGLLVQSVGINNGYIVTITLMATSLSNRYFQEVLSSYRNNPQNIVYQDLNINYRPEGLTHLKAPQAFIKDIPGKTGEEQAGVTQWVLGANYADYKVGGH